MVFVMLFHFVVVVNVNIIVIIFVWYFQLSEGIWNKFMIHQQTEDTFRKKMMLWKFLYNVVQVLVILK